MCRDAGPWTAYEGLTSAIHFFLSYVSPVFTVFTQPAIRLSTNQPMNQP